MPNFVEDLVEARRWKGTALVLDEKSENRDVND